VAGNPGSEPYAPADEKLDHDLGAGKGARGRVAQRSGVSRPLLLGVVGGGRHGPCNRLTSAAAKR